MNKLVEDYLNEKAKEAADSQQKKKDALLIELGLYEKEYSADDKSSADYPVSEFDPESGAYRYYKRIPLAVSDEEYLEILKYQKAAAVEVKKNNTVSVVFKVLAWIIFIGGFIAGIVLGRTKVSSYYSSYTEFSFAAALSFWAVSFVSGMIFLGFAEIIQLLHDLKKKN